LAQLPSPALEAASLSAERLDALAPVVLQDVPGVYVQPRVPADGRTDAILLHLVDTVAIPGRATPRDAISLLLRLPPGAAVGSAAWYEPSAAAPRTVAREATAEGTRFQIPNLKEWGVLRVEIQP
jgi:hypothetical protein